MVNQKKINFSKNDTGMGMAGGPISGQGHMEQEMNNEQAQYQIKLGALKPYCHNLRMRAQQCQAEGNLDAAGKLGVCREKIILTKQEFRLCWVFWKDVVWCHWNILQISSHGFTKKQTSSYVLLSSFIPSLVFLSPSRC